jgi:signal transduction histidine kinase
MVAISTYGSERAPAGDCRGYSQTHSVLQDGVKYQMSTWFISPRRHAQAWCIFLLAALAGHGFAAQLDPFEIAKQRRSVQDTLLTTENELTRLGTPAIGVQVHQRLGFHGQRGDPASITIDLGREVRLDEVVLFAARSVVQAQGVQTGGFPPDIRALLSQTGAEGTYELMDFWHEDAEGAARNLPLLRLHGNARTGRYLRLEIQGTRERDHLQFFTLGEIVALEGGTNRALGAAVTTSLAIDAPPNWQAANLTDGYLWCDKLTGGLKPAPYGYHSAFSPTPDSPKWVEVDLGEAFAIDEIRLVPAHPANYADVAGFGFPQRFMVEAFQGSGDESSVTIFDSSGKDYPNPGDATVCLPGKGIVARKVRITATLLRKRTKNFMFALAELQVFSGGHNVAFGKTVNAKDTINNSTWTKDALVDGSDGQRELLEWPAWLAQRELEANLSRRHVALAARLAALDLDYQDSIARVSGILTALLALTVIIVLFSLHWRSRRQRERLRQRIARDLHDEVGSRLSHLALIAEADNGILSATPTPALASFASEVRDVQRSMRDLTWLLDPANGDAQDIASRLRLTCQQLLTPSIPDVHIETRGQAPDRRLPLEWSREVLLFLKEALNNCARHSESLAADITLEWTTDAFTFVLEDHGNGFDEQESGFEAGSGLRNLRMRATKLGARLELDSAPGNGTRIQLRAPLPRVTWLSRLFPWKHL